MPQTPFVYIGIDHDPPRSHSIHPSHSLLPHRNPPLEQQQDQRHQKSFQDNFTVTTVIPILVLLVIFCRFLHGSGSGPPGEEHHRGHLIRENALRIWEMERRKAKRKAATPSERLAKIRLRVVTFQVLFKNPRTLRCTLGKREEAKSNAVAGLPSEPSIVSTTRIESKTSSDTADTLPLEYDDNDNEKGHQDDDDYVCPVCLDRFEAGDTVMFARDLSCTHVFHEECLLSWLLERRENECPSCRAMLVEEEEDETNRGGDENGIITSFACDQPNGENGTMEIASFDIESGNAKPDESTTYFIIKGRIVAEKSYSTKKEIEIETEPETKPKTEWETQKDRISLGFEENCDATSTSTPLSCQDRRLLLNRPRELSKPSMGEATKTRDDETINPSDCSVPLHLCRVLESETKPCCDKSRIIDITTTSITTIDLEQRSQRSDLQSYDDINHQSRYLELHPSVIDNRFPELHHHEFCYSSSGGDDSDEDDAILRMIHNHNKRGDTPNTIVSKAGPQNASSIFGTLSAS